VSAQASVAALYRAVGFRVYVTSQNRTSRVARGLPDLFLLHPRLNKPACQEHKRPGEPVTEEQQRFAEDWIASGGYYIRGDLDDAKSWLRAHGFLIPDEGLT
jgi:hypothetical protein